MSFALPGSAGCAAVRASPGGQQVDTPTDRVAVSNMPVEQITPLSATTQRVRFAQTPKMSTYLLYLGIGDFERIHQAVDGVDV